tara:strand:+ start:19 stop:1101 length:1083 start_codon:yes stop_codon:yes gene_type:complete
MELELFIFFLYFVLIFSIYRKRSDSNKFHLDYFLQHISFFFLLALFYLLLLFFDLGLSTLSFVLGGFVQLLSITLLILHLDSSVKGYKARFKLRHLFPIVFYLFLCTLDFFNIYIFNSPTVKIEFYNLEIINRLSFNNILFFKQFIISYLYIYLFFTYRRNIKKSLTIKKKNIFNNWVNTLVILYFFSFLSTSLLYYDFFDPSSDLLLIKIHKVSVVLNFLYIAFAPSLIYYLPLIKAKNTLQIEDNKLLFDRLKLLFDHQKIFLDNTVSLRSVSLKSDLNEDVIRVLIKNKTDMNFNDFVNSYRVEYAIETMKTDFLKNNLITTLGEKSGFKSNQTFYRAFKKLKAQTPSDYYKMYFKH